MATVYVNVPCADLYPMDLRFNASDCLASCEGVTSSYWSNCYPGTLQPGCVIYTGTVSGGSTCSYDLYPIEGFYSDDSFTCYYQAFKAITDIPGTQILYSGTCDSCYQIYYFECTNDGIGACHDRPFIFRDRPDLQAVLYIFTNAPYTGTVSVNLNYHDFVGGWDVPSTEYLYFDNSTLETLTWTRKQWIAPDCSVNGYNETTLVSVVDPPFLGRECTGLTLSQVLNRPPVPANPQYKVIYPGSPAPLLAANPYLYAEDFVFPGHPGYMWLNRYDKNSPYDVKNVRFTSVSGQQVYANTGLFVNSDINIIPLAAGDYVYADDVYYKNSVCFYNDRAYFVYIPSVVNYAMVSRYDTDTDTSTAPASTGYFKFNDTWSSGNINEIVMPYKSVMTVYNGNPTWNWLSMTAGDQVKFVWQGNPTVGWKTFSLTNAPAVGPGSSYPNGNVLLYVQEIASGQPVGATTGIPGAMQYFAIGAWTDAFAPE
jgi:hypothetical protein